MAGSFDARAHLESLVGQELRTVTGRPNTVLSVGSRDVTMDMLERDGEVTIDVETVGYRSAFVGAVLATLPGATVLPASPPRICLRT